MRRYRNTAATEVDPEGRPITRPRSRIRRDALAEEAADREERVASTAIVTDGLARLVRFVAGVIAAIIVAGILLVVLEANPANDIVNAVHDVAEWLVGPFDDMFTLDDKKAEVAVNWGIAAAVYLIVGMIVAGLIAWIGEAGLRRERVVARRDGTV
jgi:hypothetical protein